jgi:16S rRNA (cytosine1402-N4)-methyltransferase
MAYTHETVLCDELLSIFLPTGGRVFVDGTVGGAGFSVALLEASSTWVRLVGLDVDPAAWAAAAARLGRFGGRATVLRRSYVEIRDVLEELEIYRADGIVLDVGISSNLLEGERGFSFRTDGPLDMRMNPDSQVTAKGILDVYSEVQLTKLFRTFGEIRGATRLAKAVKAAVRERSLRTTGELAAVVKAAFPNAGSKLLARTFQALRIAVNGELENMEEFLAVAPALLAPGGRLAVISFHSLEDRIVKRSFRALADTGEFALGVRKPMVPGVEEVGRNPRSRSAKLRWLERVAE